MAEIKVERKTRRQNDILPIWLLVPVALLGILLISQVPHQQQAQQAAQRVPAVVAFDNHRYVTTGHAVAVPDRELVAAGRNQAGQTIFIRRGLQAGGGGGGASAKAPATAYIKTAPNTYQPFALQE